LPAPRMVIALAAFSTVSAIAGAMELLVWPMGNPYVPLALLEHTPFTSFLIPGLLLGVVVGGTSLACAIFAWRRSIAAVDATILAGGTLTVWIVAEAALMRGVHALHGLYGGLGLALLALGVHAAWRSRARRHRWLLLVTLAEAIAFLVPTCAGVLTANAGIGGVAQAALLIAAGLVEGLVLGAGQACAFPLPVRRTRYALLTAVGAGIVWSSVMLLIGVVGGETVPVAIRIVAGVATVLVGLAAIGSSQWFELRHHAERAHRWIPWTAVAWAAAMPFSFAPGPLVDESTPLSSHVVLWGCGGLLMAYVMALITWQGVRRLSGPSALWGRFSHYVATLGLSTIAPPETPVTDEDIAQLPESTKRYLRFMRVLGRPRDHSFRLSFVGRFKVSHDAPWRRCETWQYNTGPCVTRTFLMRMRFGGLPVIGRDTYRDGHGHMLAKLLDRLTVADGQGREFDLGELSTYLNDLVLLAPSMLLTPAVSFAAVDPRSFDVTLSDQGLTVRARVFIDECGAPVDFETTDRYCEDPKDKRRMLRARWTTPIDGFQEIDGRKLPARGRAIWHLPSGDLPYADFEIVPRSVAFNVGPGE
jgi:hypothetical protein